MLGIVGISPNGKIYFEIDHKSLMYLGILDTGTRWETWALNMLNHG